MTYKEIENLYLNKGYKFRKEKMALNPFGIRSKTSQSDKFDDLGGVAWIDENGQETLFNFWMTTDPGKHWLQNPMKAEGTIIIVPGQYIEVYEKGLHNGKYDCFKQCKPMYYVRDYNKDTTLDFSLYRDKEQLKIRGFWAIQGTNLHRASEWKIVELIGPYSAGCQVVQKPETFKKLIGLRDKSILQGYKRFDYTLFEE